MSSTSTHPDLDRVAVDRAVRGENVPLTAAERVRAAQILVTEHGATLKATAALLHASRHTVAGWRDAGWVSGARPDPRPRTVRPPAVCGTLRMYKIHRRRGEDCPRCRAANTAASRRYRATGSTVHRPAEGG
jgi:hypothetical protein